MTVDVSAAQKRIADEHMQQAKDIRNHYNKLSRKSPKAIRELELIPTCIQIARRFNHLSIQSRRERPA